MTVTKRAKTPPEPRAPCNNYYLPRVRSEQKIDGITHTHIHIYTICYKLYLGGGGAAAAPNSLSNASMPASCGYDSARREIDSTFV